MSDIQNPSSKQNRAATAARASKIRDAVRGAKLSPTEQERVAENMWRILAESERQGVAKIVVLHAGGAGNEGDSTKRLERFALNPDLEPAKKRIKAGRLTKGADKYIRIAEAAGRLTQTDADAYVADLFNGTRFAAAGDTSVTEDVYVELAELTRMLCIGVARKHELQRVFRACDERHLCYYGSLRQNRDDRWSQVWRGFADGTRVSGLLTDQSSWAMPYPSVLVGWTDLVQDLPFRVSAANGNPAPAEVTADRVLDDVVLKGTLKLEVRLALLPLGPGGEPEPAFVACPWVFIPFGHMREQLETGPDGKITAITDIWAFESLVPGVGANCAVRGTPESLGHYGYLCEPQFGAEAWADAFSGFAGIEPQRYYYDAYGSRMPVRVDLVSPSSCRRYLSLQRSSSALSDHECPTVTDDLDPAVEALSGSDWYKHWRHLDEGTLDDPESPRWRTSPHTLGEGLEYSLLYVPITERSFDVVLDKACERYVADVDSVLRKIDGWRETTKAELLAKWGDAGSTSVATEG